MTVLIILFSLLVTPRICYSPCQINYTIRLMYPAVKGMLCMHLTSINDKTIDIGKTCFTIGKTSQRVWSKEWRGIKIGQYEVWAEINDRLVSDRLMVVVND